MRLGIHFSYWAEDWDTTYEPYVKRAADAGFALLEISCSGLARHYQDTRRLKALKSMADQAGLSLSAGYGPNPAQNLCSNNADVVNDAVNFYRRILPSLQALGVRTLAGPLYSGLPFSQAGPREAVLERFAQNLQRVLPFARDAGVTLCLEVVNRYESNLINTAKEACALADVIGSPWVRVMLDTFHMNIEEDDMALAIRQTGSRLGHVHFSEQNRRLPGQGQLPWARICAALRDARYDGDVVIEAFVRKAGSVGEKVMLWRDLAPLEALDGDAAAAVRFLTPMLR